MKRRTDNMEENMSLLSEAQRVVVKVGTSTLTHSTGLLNIRRVEQLVCVLSDLKNAGKEIILVTSGAIGVGAGKLGMRKRPSNMTTKQACAALGQSELMYVYDKCFSEYNHNVAQVLLTRNIIEDARRKENVTNTLSRLLSLSVVPVINENDTVSTEEIEFGDNDTLSAIVSSIVGADLLIILTDIDGLYDSDPHQNPAAKRIPRVRVLDDAVLAAGGSKGSEFGTGGMAAKLHAAQICMQQDIPMIIMNGCRPSKIYDLLDGGDIGTLFYADSTQKGRI